MRQKLSLLLVLCLCVNAFCGTALADVVNGNDEDGVTVSTFPDVPATASYAEAVNTLHECGIINGDNNGNFNPNSSVTRAEAAAMICRMLGIEDEARQASTAAFSDVPTSHWANGYVAKAAEQGIINGYGNGKFGPSDSVTCQQILKMLVCAWGWKENAESYGGWPNGYATVATEYGYTANTTQVVTEDADRSTVAVYIYNTMY